jgi:hypothetical protein
VSRGSWGAVSEPGQPAGPGRTLAPPGRSRTAHRFAHRAICRLSYECKREGGCIVHVGETVNLSPNGLALHIPDGLDVGTPVNLDLARVDGPWLSATGRVVHCRRVLSGTFEVGIELESTISQSPES